MPELTGTWSYSVAFEKNGTMLVTRSAWRVTDLADGNVIKPAQGLLVDNCLRHSERMLLDRERARQLALWAGADTTRNASRRAKVNASP